MKKKSLLWRIIGLFVRDPAAISAGLVRFGKITALGGIAALIAASFWKEGLTEIGFLLLLALLGGLEKLLKEKWGVGLALAFALLLAGQPAEAQIVKFQLEAEDFSIGGGSMFGEESMTFTWDSAFAAVLWRGIRLVDDRAATGVGIEIHPAAVTSVFKNGVSVQSVETVDWRLWSLNRVKMSTFQLPGEVWEMMYLGSDLLLAEGGSLDFTGDFSARFVYGVRDGPIQLEIYMFERYRPISFSVFYRF